MELIKRRMVNMDLELKGKKALITCSTWGVGKVIALSLAAEGAEVISNGRSQEKVNQTIWELKEHYSNAVYILPRQILVLRKAMKK
jgi:short-subunit dehydrogenase